jgi:hypothetical protein
MWRTAVIVLITLLLGLGGGWLAHTYISENTTWFSSPLIGQKPPAPKPLLAFTIPALTERHSTLAQRTVLEKNIPELHKIEIIEGEALGLADFDTFVFSFTTQGGTMTGQINIPPKEKRKTVNGEAATIIMLRGYVPKDIYSTGMGTKNAAAAFAKQGYITVAPDFLGYGGSDPDLTDTWEARFIKPIQVAELITSLEHYGISSAGIFLIRPGIWAHSNGGQIALSTLEILQRSIPTTLWAPVTAPFPYSILYFGDEEADEGKSQRAWIAMFEQKYDAAEFSHTTYLNQLQGPLQIHHGTNDDAALVWWSREFVDKIDAENQRRTTAATTSAQPAILIDLELFVYPNADHNLQPSWNTAITRDLDFFQKHLITY